MCGRRRSLARAEGGEERKDGTSCGHVGKGREKKEKNVEAMYDPLHLISMKRKGKGQLRLLERKKEKEKSRRLLYFPPL